MAEQDNQYPNYKPQILQDLGIAFSLKTPEFDKELERRKKVDPLGYPKPRPFGEDEPAQTPQMLGPNCRPPVFN